MKKSLIAIIAVIVLALVGTAGYFLGRRPTATPVDKTPVAELADFEAHDQTVDEYAVSEIATAEYMMKAFEMDEKTAKDFKERPEEWLGFTVYMNLKNTTDKNLSFFNAVCPDNGKNGVYVFTETTSTLGIPAGGSYQVAIPVLIHNNNLSNDEARAIVSKMDISYLCSEAEDLTSEGAVTIITK